MWRAACRSSLLALSCCGKKARGCIQHSRGARRSWFPKAFGMKAVLYHTCTDFQGTRHRLVRKGRAMVFLVAPHCVHCKLPAIVSCLCPVLQDPAMSIGSVRPTNSSLMHCGSCRTQPWIAATVSANIVRSNRSGQSQTPWVFRHGLHPSLADIPLQGLELRDPAAIADP